MGVRELMSTYLRQARFFILLSLLAASAAVRVAAGEFAFSYAVAGPTKDLRFGQPSGIVVSERLDALYLADIKESAVYSMDLHGVSRPTDMSNEKFVEPYALALDAEGSLYVTLSETAPIKVIAPGGRTSSIELPRPEGDAPPSPGRMAFDREGNLYVVDRANCRLYVLDRDRKLKLRLGGEGSRRGEFRRLQDVAVDRQGRIYALDSVGVPVQVFDRKGKYLYRFGFHGEGSQDIGNPSAIALDRNEQVWIADRGRHSLVVFDRAGEFLRRFGVYGVGEGMIFDPVDIEIDAFGRVYIVEGEARRMQVFTVGHPYESFGTFDF